MKMIATLFVVFAFASSALGQCPAPVKASDFDKIAGRWYQIAGPSVTVGNSHPTCFTHDFTHREDGDFNLTLFATLPDGSKYSENDLAERVENQDFLLLSSIPKTTPFALSFYIADTDYDNYLAAYTCYVVPDRSYTQFGLILSRTNTMSADKYAELSDLLVNKFGISSDSFEVSSQKDCKYWPISH